MHVRIRNRDKYVLTFITYRKKSFAGGFNALFCRSVVLVLKQEV